MTVRTDNRLHDVPMQPVQCQRCEALVGVRKSSWQQTSIQWDAAATTACRELDTAPEPTPDTVRGYQGDTCEALRDSIAKAAQDGTVHVPDDRY